MDTRTPTKEIKLLALDYDGCAFTLNGTRPDLLSTAVIQHALTGGYTAFYGVTFRCWYLTWLLKKSAILKATYSHYTQDAIANNITTYKVTENFAKITQLPNLAVSMLDDALSGECGSTYEKLVKPNEKDGIPAASGVPFIPLCNIPTYYQSKNTQLLQVAQHAAQQYKDVSITINYLDDHLYLSYSAAKVMQDPAWPKQVTLNTFHHNASEDNAPIVPIYNSKINYLAEKKSAWTLRRCGMFAVSALCIGTAAISVSFMSKTYSI